jgi:nitroreductase
MTSFHDLLLRRRSVREYLPQALTEQQIDSLVEAALLSPTAKSIGARTVTVVDDPRLISELSRCKPHGASFLAGAPIAFVISADVERAAAAVEDSSIAAITLQYAAEELGLGSCWIQIRGRFAEDGRSSGQYVGELLHLPDTQEVEAIIAVGSPAETLPPQSPESLDRSAVRRNTYEHEYYAE